MSSYVSATYLHRTKDGAICDPDGLVVTVSTVMWVKVRGWVRCDGVYVGVQCDGWKCDVKGWDLHIMKWSVIG